MLSLDVWNPRRRLIVFRSPKFAMMGITAWIVLSIHRLWMVTCGRLVEFFTLLERIALFFVEVGVDLERIYSFMVWGLTDGQYCSKENLEFVSGSPPH